MISRFTSSLPFLIGFVLAIGVVEIVNASMGHQLNAWGIFPRSVHGLAGIPLAPFLHGGIGHVISNSIPFLVGWLDSLSGKASPAAGFVHRHWGRWIRGVVVGPLGRPHWSKRAGLWLLRLLSSQRMVRTKVRLHIIGYCSNNSLRRLNLGSATRPGPCILGGAPIRANCRCFGC